MSNMVYILLVVLLFVIIIILAMYNSIIRLYNSVKNAKADLDVCLNKRFDLIPNLVECVKGYSKYENTTLSDITELRSKYNNSKNLNVNEIDQMNNELNKFLVVVESYPELKADSQYLNLQNQLSEIETSLEEARKRYNFVTTRYNTKIETVPSNIVAGIFNFKRVELLTTEENKKENVKVEV